MVKAFKKGGADLNILELDQGRYAAMHSCARSEKLDAL